MEASVTSQELLHREVVGLLDVLHHRGELRDDLGLAGPRQAQLRSRKLPPRVWQLLVEAAQTGHGQGVVPGPLPYHLGVILRDCRGGWADIPARLPLWDVFLIITRTTVSYALKPSWGIVGSRLV